MCVWWGGGLVCACVRCRAWPARRGCGERCMIVRVGSSRSCLCGKLAASANSGGAARSSGTVKLASVRCAAAHPCRTSTFSIRMRHSGLLCCSRRGTFLLGTCCTCMCALCCTFSLPTSARPCRRTICRRTRCTKSPHCDLCRSRDRRSRPRSRSCRRNFCPGKCGHRWHSTPTGTSVHPRPPPPMQGP